MVHIAVKVTYLYNRGLFPSFSCAYSSSFFCLIYMQNGETWKIKTQIG